MCYSPLTIRSFYQYTSPCHISLKVYFPQMADSKPKNVAIIGAGLSGLSLALALHQQSIPCTLYELRDSDYTVGGGIMLSPNALEVLDKLGVYSRIKPKGYNFDTLDFRNDAGELTDKYWFGDEKQYGYRALRIYRQVLISVLTAMVQELGIPIQYSTKFSSIISETAEEVTFKFVSGNKASASLLVGADGIHSSVRKYTHSNIKTAFSGIVAVTCHAPTSKIRLPPNYDMPVTIAGKPGAFVMAPQAVDGSETFFGIQHRHEELDKAGWDALFADKAQLVSFLQKDMSDWPDHVQSALENIDESKLNMWPFYVVPKLDKWASPGNRVIILGDAAHAIPPTAGQGVNQAFEDIYSFALLLANLSESMKLEDALVFWQRYRQERVDKVLHLTMLMNSKRMSAQEQAKLKSDQIWSGKGAISGDDGQLKWLYKPEIERNVSEWVKGQSKV